MASPLGVRIDRDKAALRDTAKRNRAEAAAAAPKAGPQLAEHFLATIDMPKNAVVSGFWPMGDEIDLRPLLESLHARGHVVGLPVVVWRDHPLIFRSWAPGDALEPAGLGTREPSQDKPKVLPQVVIVPLLAFDRLGYRVGYGGGFYDRTLEQLRAHGDVSAIGVAYAGQEVEAVPHDDKDQPLDFIVTESGTIDIKTGKKAL